MKSLLTFIFALFFISAMAQQDASVQKFDSVIVKKFVLSSHNDAAEEGKFKTLVIKIQADRELHTYGAVIESTRDINSYLEVKDQDDNVIYFHEVSIKPGTNNIKLDTEDGEQSVFTFSFQDIKTAKPAVYVLREEEEVVYTTK